MMPYKQTLLTLKALRCIIYFFTQLKFQFSPIWSCLSLPRPTTSNGWKLQLHLFNLRSNICKYYIARHKWVKNKNDNLEIKGLISSGRQFSPLTVKFFNLNFHPLEVLSRWRDPQLQVGGNYSYLTKLTSTVFKYCWLMSHFIFNMFKRWYLMC